MKILLTLFVLLFPSSVLAEDISDFQIEGISVGDSLLDYFSKSKINNAENYDNLPSDMKFRIIEIPLTSYNLYDVVQFYYKPNDRNFIIFAISGTTPFLENINDCYITQLRVVDELESIFKDTEFVGPIKGNHIDDPSGKSTYTIFYARLNSGGLVTIGCYDWSNEVNYEDHLKVSLHTETTADWINSNYGLN